MNKVLIAIPLLIGILTAPVMAGEGERFHGRNMRNGECIAGPGPGGHMGPYHGLCYGDPKFLREELNLSSEQIGKVAEINDRFRKERDMYYKEMMPGKEELKKLLLAGTINYDEVRKTLKQISDIEIELRILQIKHRLELQKVLTPEQLDKLKNEYRHMKHRRMRKNND